MAAWRSVRKGGQRVATVVVVIFAMAGKCRVLARWRSMRQQATASQPSRFFQCSGICRSNSTGIAWLRVILQSSFSTSKAFALRRLAWGTANAQPITIGFWSAHHRTGLYSGSVRNNAANRSYAFTYTHNVADVSQYNTITIPGDTAGTWLIDNTIGILLDFSMGAGSTYTAPSANTWLAGNYLAAPGQINAVAATSDVFRLTGVTVLPGNEAPSAARSPFVMRSYDQELLICKRYFYNGLPPLIGGWHTPRQYEQVACRHSLPMRAAATVTVTSTVTVMTVRCIMTSQRRTNYSTIRSI